MQLAVEYGQDIRFLKVDTDEEHELASQMEVKIVGNAFIVEKGTLCSICFVFVHDHCFYKVLNYKGHQ